MRGIRDELVYLQRVLIAINSQLPQPRGKKRITLRKCGSEKDGIDLIIEARIDLIKMRALWVELKFKNYKRKKGK